MSDSNKIRAQKDFAIVFFFFLAISCGVFYYTSHFNVEPGFSPLIIPLMLGLTLPSKVLPIPWKMTGVLFSLVFTASYFGVSWPRRRVILEGSLNDSYFTASYVTDPVGLTPYVAFAWLVSIIFIVAVVYYKMKIKKVSVYD